MNKALHARYFTIISFYSIMIILIHHANLSSNQNFLFKTADMNIALYAHVIDTFIKVVMIKNDFVSSIKISRNACFDTITEIQYFNAFHVNSNSYLQELVKQKSRRVHKALWFSRVLKVATIAYAMITTTFISTSNVIHSNDVIIHNFFETIISSFIKLVNDYSSLWKSGKFFKLLMNQRIRISLKSNCETTISEKLKMYSLEVKDKKLIDQIFDDLQTKKRFKLIIELTIFSYLLFVVWKTVNDKKKRRVVVNIKDLNFMILSDVYFFSLQADIISTVKNCNYLSTINCVSFFYRWRVYFENKHKLIVISHKEQEIFQIVIMSYKNSSFYVQT
jgi:hypothetical protein